MWKTPGTLFVRLDHYFSARSRFDLHSPFVYTLYSGILKDKSWYPEYHQLEHPYPRIKKKKYFRLLFRIARWFKPENTFFIGKDESAEKAFLRAGYPESRISGSTENPDDPFEMIFLDMHSCKEPVEKWYSSFQQHLTTESVLIIWSIQNPLTLKKAWKHIQTLPGITVTIDLFYLGIIFVNPDLSREDFRIRF